MKLKSFSQIMIESNDDYRGEHEAADKESGAPLYDVTLNGIFPEDIYSYDGVRLYSGTPYDPECIRMIKSFRHRPNRTVKIYRAVPKVLSIEEQIWDLQQQKAYIQKYGKTPPKANTSMDKSRYYEKLIGDIEELEGREQPPIEKIKINKNDWVTISRSYAAEHGRSNLNNMYKIISKTVKAKDIYCDGDVAEWGYDPE